LCVAVVAAAGAMAAAQGDLRPVPLQRRVTSVQPMTGLVMWEGSKNSATDAIQLEYSYMRYADVVARRGEYDWTAVERKLDAIAGRQHQAVLRFWDTWPGRPSAVPDYIKALPDYRDHTAESEGRPTGFPDWAHPEYQRFILEFYARFAARYDRDPRLAFLETGFGLWAEYHIYSGPETPGVTFPSLEFQARFFRHLAAVLRETPWMISQDAHAAKRSPFASQPDLLALPFGIFDDTFHLAWNPGYNQSGWTFFGRDRHLRAPAGGEILFPNRERADLVADQWPVQARNFGITFMITEQLPRWTPMDRIRALGMACGYRFGVRAFESGGRESRVIVENTGAAPIYHDAWIAVNGVRARESLKLLAPGERRRFTVPAGGPSPVLTIEADRLVPGQTIDFEADLK
jgi:hypothetical protein